MRFPGGGKSSYSVLIVREKNGSVCLLGQKESLI